jgi:carboxymethylenebutenolidase
MRSTMPEARAVLVGLGFGANLGDRASTIARAVREIEARRIGVIVAASSLWRSAPWGVVYQPPFLNACALIETTLAPHALLGALKQIETDLGRTPTERWGPRVIDIDILFYGGVALNDPDLTIPHRDLAARGFVLAPLAEIAADRTIGALSVREALARVDRAGLEIEIEGAAWLRRARGDVGMGETIELTCKDGVTISAYRARPDGAPKGGLVVLQEIFGVNHHIRAVADRFAAAGWLVIAPALFDRVERGVELGYGEADRPRAMDLRGSTRLEATLADIEAAIGAAKDGGRVALVGYCWGGTLAFMGACRLSGIAAAVGYYGGGIASVAAERPRVPLMLHFGARDKHIPLRDVERIRAMQPHAPVFVYDADHGFNCDERESYDAAAAEQASERTMEFLASELK